MYLIFTLWAVLGAGGRMHRSGGRIGFFTSGSCCTFAARVTGSDSSLLGTSFQPFDWSPSSLSLPSSPASRVPGTWDSGSLSSFYLHLCLVRVLPPETPRSLGWGPAWTLGSSEAPLVILMSRGCWEALLWRSCLFLWGPIWVLGKSDCVQSRGKHSKDVTMGKELPGSSGCNHLCELVNRLK